MRRPVVRRAGDLVCTRPGPIDTQKNCMLRAVRFCMQAGVERTTDKDVRPSISRRTHIRRQRAVDPVPARSCGADERSMQIEQRRFVEASRARRAMNIRPGLPFTWSNNAPYDVQGLHTDDPCPSVNY
jgi:hypothetical protein